MARSATDDRRSVGLLIAVGVVASNLFMLCVWMWWAFGTHNGFADMSVDSLKDPAVRAVISAQIVDQMREQQGVTQQVALAYGPALEPIVGELVKTDAFKALFYAGARHLHEVIFTGARSRILIAVDDAAPMARDSLEISNPELAAKVPDDALQVAVGLSQNRGLDRIVYFASITGWLLWPIGAVAVGSFAAALLASRDRRGSLFRIGLGLAGSGLFWTVFLIVAVAVVSRLVDGPVDRAAMRAVFRSVTHVLMLTVRVVFCGGLVIAMAALAAGDQPVRAKIDDGVQWAKLKWSTPHLHGVLGAAIVTVGVLIAAYPEVLTAMVARTLGLTLAFLGLVAVFDFLGVRTPDGLTEGRQTRAMRRIAMISSAVCVVVVLLLGFGGRNLYEALHTQNGSGARDGVGCNGELEACDLRLDEVVLAGTHNSMSAGSEDFYFARHPGGIVPQLRFGVRALLVDVHNGCRIGPYVRTTDYQAVADVAAARGELTEPERKELDRVLALIGAACPPDRDSEVFLCHVYCELGSMPATEAFEQIDDFLRWNGNEVVTIVIEDDFVQSEALAGVIRDSGLDRRAVEYQPGVRLPTLGEMVQSGRQVLLMTENEHSALDDSAPPWLPWAYGGLLQDTPYKYASVEDFSCVRGRGVTPAALLMANHWIEGDAVDPGVAAHANSFETVTQRAFECSRVQGRFPNVIAVDLYTRGDVYSAVNELNRLTWCRLYGVGSADCAA